MSEEEYMLSILPPDITEIEELMPAILPVEEAEYCGSEAEN